MSDAGVIDVGLYENGLLTDFGKRIQKNGDSWTGSFVEGQILGNGVMHSKGEACWIYGQFDGDTCLEKIVEARSVLPPRFTNFES